MYKFCVHPVLQVPLMMVPESQVGGLEDDFSFSTRPKKQHNFYHDNKGGMQQQVW